MFRSPFFSAALLLTLLASCAPKATPVPTPSSAPETPLPGPSELRFALVGPVTDVNVWALFDAKGYSYNNYAVRNEYWPRLYQLSIPDQNFEAMAASGMPSPVQQEGNFFTATVPLRVDLNWTDGTPFTVDDVAFTVNTALNFQLGFDWHDYYNPDYLDHAEAADARTVKFYFKKQPNVGIWQYGALQGPIVQKAYWSSKIAASAALLPPDSLAMQIESLKQKLAVRQQRVDASNQALATATSNEVEQIQITLARQQDDVNETSNDLAKAQSDFDSAISTAHESLYALDDKDEPTLGNWMPAGEENGEWINKVNPAHPFGEPKFDQVIHKNYASEGDAVKALQDHSMDAILEPEGLSYDVIDKLGLSISNMQSPANKLSFLVFNLSNSNFRDLAFRRALACITDTKAMTAQSRVIKPLMSFVVPMGKNWNNQDIHFQCNSLDSTSRELEANQILKTAGYSWQYSSTSNANWNGLNMPNGQPYPSILLMSTYETYEMLDWTSFDNGVGRLGIPFGAGGPANLVNSVNYQVFSSHQYDMAILGWQVGEYPGYLCDWFGDGNPFGYHSDRLQSACEALNSTSDLGEARKQVYEIQSILAEDLPFIPLYSGLTYDVYRNITYPFNSVLGGLSGVYGAPSLAIPAP